MFKKLLFVAVLVSLIATAFSIPVRKLQDGNCPSSPARLKQADIAVVTVGDGETLNLRVSPNVNAERIVKIPAYTYVTIIAGPICDGGYRWYEVGWEGKDGWSAEVGPDGEYNMIPNGDPVPVPTSNDPDGTGGESDGGYCPGCWPIVPGTPSPILQIGTEYYFNDFESNQLRKIQNQKTLEALGFPIDEIDVSQGSTEGIQYGSDVPDVNDNPDEFCAFKYRYFATYPRPSWSPCQGIIIEPQKQVISVWYGTDIYIFIYDEKGTRIRKVPNPDTLDALSITRDQVQEFPSWVGTDVVDGGDIPDVNIDPVGFCEFKHTSFPQLPDVPEGPCNNPPSLVEVPTDTPEPLIEVPIEPVAIEEPFYCNWWIIGWLACDLAEANSANARCEPQCMTLMRKDEFRPDMNKWSVGTGDSSPLDVLANAEKETPYNDPPKTGPLMQIRVRESTEQPEAGDLIIWQAGCGGASDVGHIGEVVSSVGITVNIDDSNWNNKCDPRNNVQIQILSCMRFVTEPFPAGTYVPTVQPTVINCDDYQGLQNFACNYIPWWKP